MRIFPVTLCFLALALSACGPGRVTPAGDGDDGNQRGGDLDGFDPAYVFQDPEVLLSTLTDPELLGVEDQDYTAPDDPEGIHNPQEDPVGFLKVRLHTLGSSTFDSNPFYSDLGGFNGLGMKNWILASNGACSMAMMAPATARPSSLS